MTSENAKIQIELGRTLTAYTAMTDSGNHQTYTSAADVWSGKSGYEPSIRPNGVVAGLNLLTTHTANNTVTVAGFTAYSQGTLRTVTATTAVCSRGSDYKINSVTMTTSGAISVVAGTASTAALTETRGAAGGPPFLPVNSVEIGQVRYSSSAAATVAASEIFQVVGTHMERSDYPTWETNNIGDGTNADSTAKQNAYVHFVSSLPLSHSSSTTKRVYAQYYTPVMSDLAKVLNFVPITNSHSVTSTQYYGGTDGAQSSSLGQGSFTVRLTDGITDAMLAEQDAISTIKFFQDRNKTPFILSQGKLGISPTYPVADHVQASVTISGDRKSASFSA